MRVTTAVILAVTFLMAGGLQPTSAEGDDLNKAQDAQWKSAVRHVSTLPPGQTIDPAALAELSKGMKGFKPRDLLRMARYENLEDQDEALKPRLQHALRSLAHLRRLGTLLNHGPSICLLLGSDQEINWVRAIIEILREPLGERLGKVADILSRDEHGAVRLGAGTIALYLNAFAGGRGSEWVGPAPKAWDPTPLVRRIAERLLDDRNPAVSCRFARRDAYTFEDKAIIDMLVERLDDQRQRPAVKHGFLSGVEQTVGDACRDTLAGQFIFYRRKRFSDSFEGMGLSKEQQEAMRPAPKRRVTSLPADGSGESIARWWSKVRDQWSFRPDGAGWKTVFDSTVTMDRKRGQSIKTPYGEIVLTMPLHREAWLDGEPLHSIRVEARAKDERLYVDCNMGNPIHHLGYVSRGETGSGRASTITSIMYAPSNADGVRVRMRIWTHEPPQPVKREGK